MAAKTAIMATTTNSSTSVKALCALCDTLICLSLLALAILVLGFWAFLFFQQSAPPARVLHVPDTVQSTRPPDNDGTSTNVSDLKPDPDTAAAVITPVESEEAAATYLVEGEQPLAGPTQGTDAGAPPPAVGVIAGFTGMLTTDANGNTVSGTAGPPA